MPINNAELEGDRRFELLFEKARDSIIWADAQTGIITSCNRATELLFECDRSYLIGKNQSILHPVDKFDHYKKVFEDHVKSHGSAPVEAEIATPAGVIKSVEIASNVIKIGDDLINQGIFREITEKKNRERELQNSEAKFRTLFENSSEAILWAEVDTATIIDCNKAACILFEKEHDEIVGKNIATLHPKSLENVVIAEFKNIFDRKGVIRQKIVTKTGIEKIVDINSTIINIQGKKIDQGVFKDVTNEVIAYKKLAESEQRYREIVETTDNLITEVNAEGILLFANHAAAQIYGLPVEECIGKSAIDFVHPDDKEHTQSSFNKWVANKESKVNFENRQISITGIVRYMSWTISFLYNQDGGLDSIKSIAKDITERKINESRILESEKYFREFAQSLPQMVFECDTEGNLLFVNDFTLTLFGYSKDEFAEGINIIRDILSEEDLPKFVHNFSEGLAGNEVAPVTYNVKKKDGAIIPVIVYANFIREGEKVRRINGLITDITDQKKLENELVQSKLKAEESDTLKSAFLANMSHEIRTPLNAILGFSQLLDKREIKEQRKKEYLKHILSNGKLLLKLIEDVIRLSKIESGQIKLDYSEESLNEIFDSLYENFKTKISLEGKNIRLVFTKDLPLGADIVRIDSLRIQQVLNNLIENAIKFTETGQIEFGYKLKKDKLHFWVKDTGIGISPEKKQIIFERFNQADETIAKNYGGTGLGLAISNGLVNIMNGSIYVESTPGEGSEFSFSLPYIEAPQKNDAVRFKKTDFDWSGKTVLVVEDNDETGELLQECLIPYGIKFLRAYDSNEGLELLRTSKDISIIIIDLHLPGIDGLEFTRISKSENRHIPVILQTASAFTDTKSKSAKAGADAFLLKPIEVDKLLFLIDSLLHKTKKPD